MNTNKMYVSMGILYTSSVRTVLCKECPLTELADCITRSIIMASVFVMFSSEVLAEGMRIFESDMAWYNVL